MIYTFYSYKGGVGRSMALANIAELFYREGLKVLMIDWDLEAPGLEKFFSLSSPEMENASKQLGLTDMLREYKAYMSNPVEEENDGFQFLPTGDLSPYFFSLYPLNPKGGRLWLLPAGQRDENEFDTYINFVRTFDWLDFYENWKGEQFFEWFRKEILKLADVVLIDSRTGLSEMGGVCTYQLADIIVMFTSTNQQSMEGTHEMLKRLQTEEIIHVREQLDRKLEILVIPSRVEDRAEQEKFTNFKNDFINTFGELEKPPAIKWIEQRDWSNYLWDSYIPHVPIFSFGENLVFSGDRKTGDTLKDCYRKIGSLLALLAPVDSKIKNSTIAKDLVPVFVESAVKSKEKQIIRVFLSSPGDVSAERAIAYRIIQDIQDVLEIMEQNISLRAIGWEQVPPGIGLPNEIIIDRFPIEECDIFVFIIWKRFGSPLGTRRKDGSKYSSGSQEEFEKAYLRKSQGASGKPIIMVYQKKDEFPITSLSAREIGQYRRVIEFMEDCGSTGKHPVLTRSFLSRDYEGLLRRNLLDTILRLSTSKGSDLGISGKPGIPFHEGLGPESARGENRAMIEWLSRNNLSANPFTHYVAETEEDLIKYYVPFKGFLLISNEIVSSNKNWLFFGVEGSGKTALKQFIASRCAPVRLSNTLVIPYETSDFLEALAHSRDVNDIKLFVSQQIFQHALKITDLQAKYGPEIRTLQEPSTIFLRLSKLLEEETGYQRALCLLDLANEVSDDAVSKLIDVLAQLVALPSDRVSFRLFLPKSLQGKFMRQGKYLGKCELQEIRWEEKELKELIKQRMVYYSRNKAQPTLSLRSIYEGTNKTGFIEDEIVKLSEGNPRAVIWMANRLFLEHSQNEPIPLKIKPRTWDRVQLDWWNNGRNLILGTIGRTETFLAIGNDVYFNNKPLKLTKRSKSLLKSLVDADGRTCSKEELIRMGWPDINSDEVTDAALREAMRRLKSELKEKNNIDSAWVDTQHDQGYRLLEPE